MAELRAPEQNRLLGQLARMLRTTEGDIAAPEFLPRGLDVMGLVRQLMLPSAETVEKLSYGDPLFRMPTQSNIPITADREYLAEVLGMAPAVPAASRATTRLSNEAADQLVRAITGTQATAPQVLEAAGQMLPLSRMISPEVAAKVFPDTKVVDEAGNPKLLYHGTNKEFEQFDESMLGTKTGNPTSKMGYFFSDSPSEASRYAADWGKEGGNVRPVYLDIKNPKRLTYKQMNDISMALFDESSSLPVNAWKTKEGQAAIEASAIAGSKRANKMAMDLRQQLIDEGYDGAVVRIGGKDEYIAFNPNQIKSAISDPQMAGLLDQPAQSVVENPLYKLTKEEFLGKPKIVTPKGSKDLEPRVLTTNENVDPEPFMGGKYSVKMSEDGAAVFDGDKVVASYNFGDTLVVDPKYRKRGIAEELVYQWRSRYPDVAKAKTRTKVSQNVQKKVWERIQNEKFRAENGF
jgi:hypothetical protein